LTVGPSTAVRPTTRIARPRRAEKSIVAEAAKVVAGGVIGLALGLLVLWWGFRRDPLELGPTFAAYVPWLVPAQFHGSAGRPSSEAIPPENGRATSPGGRSATSTSSNGRKVKSRTQSAKRDRAQPEDELQTLPLLEEPAKPAAVPELSLPLALPSGPSAQSPARSLQESDASRGALKPPAEQAARPPAPDASDSPRQDKAQPMPDLRDLLDLSFPAQDEQSPLARLLPASPAADTLAAAAAAEAALREYESLPGDDVPGRQRAFAAWYTALGQTAQTLGAVVSEGEDPHFRQASLHPLLDSLEGSPGRRSAAAHLTIQTWPQTVHGQGLLAVGKVAQCFEQGPPYKLLLEVQVRDQSVTLPLVLSTRPADFCQRDDELIVLGRVVEQPHERLAGYADEHPKALWVCLARRVPPAP
jgi:hypothetical protein